MPRQYAVLCLGRPRGLPGAAVVLQSRTVAEFNTPMEYPPEVLASKAREMAAGLRLSQEARRFSRLDGRAGWPPRTPRQASQIAKVGRVAGFRASILAVYRQSPNLLLVAAPYGDIGVTNPPPTASGHGAGEPEYRRIPAQIFAAIPPAGCGARGGSCGAGRGVPRGWAGSRQFHRDHPKFVPLGAADELHSWKGPHPKIPNLDLTVEMAAWKGRVTTVRAG
jgi:hypothetical protein